MPVLISISKSSCIPGIIIILPRVKNYRDSKHGTILKFEGHGIKLPRIKKRRLIRRSITIEHKRESVTYTTHDEIFDCHDIHL